MDIPGIFVHYAFVLGLPYFYIYKMIALYGFNFDVVSGEPSYLPNYMMFSSFQPGETTDYTAFIIGFMIMLSTGVFKMVNDDKRYKSTHMEGENFMDLYAKDVLIAWDNSLLSSQECEDYAGALGQTLEQKLIVRTRAYAK